MKKITLLFFTTIAIITSLSAQEGKTPIEQSRTVKNVASSGQLNIEANITGAAVTIENQNDSDYSSLSFFNELGQFQGEIGIGNTNAINSGNLIFSANSADYVFSKSTVDSSNESMRITSSGNVGIGTSTPTEKLDVNGKIVITADTGNEMVITNGDTWNHANGNQVFGDGDDHWIVASYEGSPESGGITGNGDCITMWSPGDGAPGQPAADVYILDEDSFDSADTDPYNNGAVQAYLNSSGMWTVSDMNKKEAIRKVDNSLAKIQQLNAYSYKYKINDAERAKQMQQEEVVGIMAQELERVIPQAVNKNAAGEYFVNYNQITPVLIEAIKELTSENADLKTRLAQLEAAVEALTRE